MIDDALEFYETPKSYTRWLFDAVAITGRCFEPCVGSGAILEGSSLALGSSRRHWVTNDLAPQWIADYHMDARSRDLWTRVGGVDWTVSNTPFTPAIEIIDRALEHSRIGVAMHLRASIHEVLKTGLRRTWMAQHTPTGILWLPRFAYQRSKKTGEWSTDSVCACWVIWLKDPEAPQFIKYAPTWVLDALDAETQTFRKRMDALMKGHYEPASQSPR